MKRASINIKLLFLNSALFKVFLLHLCYNFVLYNDRSFLYWPTGRGTLKLHSVILVCNVFLCGNLVHDDVTLLGSCLVDLLLNGKVLLLLPIGKVHLWNSENQPFLSFNIQSQRIRKC